MDERLVEFSEAGWFVRAVSEHRELARCLARLQLPPSGARPLRDDYRSYVGIFEINARRLVAKSPRLKNRGAWSRFLTLFRAGEASSTVRACVRARGNAAPVQECICSLERRSKGMIVDSWMFYFFVEAAPCDHDQHPIVVAALESLHKTGWVHGDPHIANFLWDGARVHLIDCKPRPARLGSLSKCYDLVRLVNSRPEIRDHLGSTPWTLAYRLAAGYDHLIHGWRNTKRALRAGIGHPRVH